MPTMCFEELYVSFNLGHSNHCGINIQIDLSVTLAGGSVCHQRGAPPGTSDEPGPFPDAMDWYQSEDCRYQTEEFASPDLANHVVSSPLHGAAQRQRPLCISRPQPLCFPHFSLLHRFDVRRLIRQQPLMYNQWTDWTA
jgi:hypothetical protein